MDLRLTFNEDPQNYDHLRPSYVTELFHDIIHYSELTDSKSALEIGIGTGKATLPFLKTGCKLTAVELGKNLAEYVKQKFSEFSNFEVMNLDFEQYTAEGHPYDLIYSATAFHWIPQEFGLTKVYRLLAPGGTIALFWNHPFVGRDDDELHQAIRKAYAKYRPPEKKLTEFDESSLKPYTDALSAHGFKEVRAKIYRQTRQLNAQEYVSLLNTYSDHRALEIEVKAGLEHEIALSIDKFGGLITIYDTVDLYLAKKPLTTMR